MEIQADALYFYPRDVESLGLQNGLNPNQVTDIMRLADHAGIVTKPRLVTGATLCHMGLITVMMSNGRLPLLRDSQTGECFFEDFSPLNRQEMIDGYFTDIATGIVCRSFNLNQGHRLNCQEIGVYSDLRVVNPSHLRLLGVVCVVRVVGEDPAILINGAYSPVTYVHPKGLPLFADRMIDRSRALSQFFIPEQVPPKLPFINNAYDLKTQVLTVQ